MKRWHANLVLLLAGAVWGMGFVAQSTAMDNIGPFWFIALRFFVAVCVVLPFAYLESKRSAKYAGVTMTSTTPAGRLSIKDVFKFALIGCCLFAGMATQQVGLLTTTVTNSGFLTGLYVVFTPIIGVILFKQKPHPVVWLATLLAFSGIAFLTGGELTDLTLGDFYTVACAFFFALQVLLIAQFVGGAGRPLALSLTQFIVTGSLALLVALVVEPFDWRSVAAAGPEILYAGVFASGLAFSLQVIGQRYTSAAQAAIFLSAEAPFAALFAFWWLNERVPAVGVLGCLMILVAMLSVEIVPMWSNRQSTSKIASHQKGPDER